MNDHSCRPPNHPDLTDPTDTEVRLFEIDAIDPAEKSSQISAQPEASTSARSKAKKNLRLYRVACGCHVE